MRHVGLDQIENKYAFMKRLEKFEAPFLEEKLVEKGIFSSHEEYAETFSEFKKYVALGKLTGKPLGMTSKKVDEVWHQFILFTKEYFSFCNEYLGYYLHHNPRTKTRDLPRESVPNFVHAYRNAFGKIPPVWGKASALNAVCSDDCSSCDDESHTTKNVKAGCSDGCQASCDESPTTNS